VGNSSVKVLPTGGASAMLSYILSPNSNDPDKEANPERVKYISSTMLADPDDQAGMLAEFEASAGRKYDCIASRVSFQSGDELSEEQFAEYAERFAKEYLSGRPYIAVLHGDTAHRHFHLLAPVRDSQGRVLNFRGAGAHKEALRRMDIVDRISSDMGLTVTPREEGKYNTSRDREGIEAKRMRAEKKPRWMDQLKQRINTAKSKANTAEEFISLCGHMGVGVRFRGAGVSYDYRFEGKNYVARGRRLGTDYTPQALPFKVPEAMKYRSPEATQHHDANRTPSPIRPTTQTGGAVGSHGRGGKDAGVVTSSGRVQASDEAHQAEAESINEAIQAQDATMREIAQKLQHKPRR
jgi:MobA/VirD2-like, nuclease domain